MKNDNQLKKFLWSCLRGDTDTTEIDLSSWALLKPCFSSQNYQRCMLLFCHFSHVLCLKLQLYKLLCKTMLSQLKQKSLPIFYDEGVFRLVLNIYLKCPEEFKTLMPMLGGFHTAGLSMNILCVGDKLPMEEHLFKNTTGNLLPTLRFLGGLYNFRNFVIILSLM